MDTYSRYRIYSRYGLKITYPTMIQDPLELYEPFQISFGILQTNQNIPKKTIYTCDNSFFRYTKQLYITNLPSKHQLLSDPFQYTFAMLPGFQTSLNLKTTSTLTTIFFPAAQTSLVFYHASYSLICCDSFEKDRNNLFSYLCNFIFFRLLSFTFICATLSREKMGLLCDSRQNFSR